MSWTELAHSILDKLNPQVMPWILLVGVLLWGLRWLVLQLIRTARGVGDGAQGTAAGLESFEHSMTSKVDKMEQRILSRLDAIEGAGNFHVL